MGVMSNLEIDRSYVRTSIGHFHRDNYRAVVHVPASGQSPVGSGVLRTSKSDTCIALPMRRSRGNLCILNKLPALQIAFMRVTMETRNVVD
jgi:hypothetical protein